MDSPTPASPTTAQHTPGPWKLVWREPPLVQFAGWTVKQDDDIQFPIAIIHQTLGGFNSPQQANALLIAAAPDLLDALLLAVRAYENMRRDNPKWKLTSIPIWLVDARHAIAKATVQA